MNGTLTMAKRIAFLLLLLSGCGPASYQGRSIEDWSAQLISANGDEQKQACIALGKIGRPAVPTLRQALRSDRASVRCAAANGLARMYRDAEEAIPDLIPLLHDADSEVQAAAARAIGRTNELGAAAVPDLCQLLASTDHACLMEAVDALGRIGPDAAQAAPTLCELLRHPNLELRRLVARHLGGTRAVAAIPALLEALHDEDRQVRLYAGFSLRKIAPDVAAQHGFW
jgi:HEAT repeat protein